MAIEKIIDLQIQSNADQAEKSVGTLKQQLKAAKAEVLALSDQFGLTSQQAIHAAERAAELGHEISAANKLVKAFNPSTTLNSTTQALGSVKEGFEVASHSMKTFGVESTQLEGALGKVSLAMEFSSGITQIQESQESFKRLSATLQSYSIVQKAITAGQWLWNAAMTANPLGAIVLAITAVIAAGYGLIKFFGDVASTSKVAMQGIKENTKALEDSQRITKKHNQDLKDSSDYHLAMAKASGKSSEEIRKLSITEINADISLKALNRTIAQNTYYRELNNLANLKATGATKEAIKNQDELVKNSLENFSNENKALTESLRNKKLLIQKNNVEVRQEQTDNIEKSRKDAETRAEEQRKIDEKNLQKDFLKTLPELDESNIELELGLIDAKNQTKREKDAKYKQDSLDAQAQYELQNATLLYDSEIAKTERESELNEQKLQSKRNYYAAASGLVQDGQNFMDKIEAAGIGRSRATIAIQKSLALIQIGIDTAKAFSTAVPMAIKAGEEAAKLAGPAAPIAGPLAVGVSYATSALTIIGNINKAKKLLGGGGGVSAPGIGDTASASGGGSTPPRFNVVGASGTNQLAQSIGAQQQQPIQAYVVANNVTTAQSLQRNIIESATIGG